MNDSSLHLEENGALWNLFPHIRMLQPWQSGICKRDKRNSVFCHVFIHKISSWLCFLFWSLCAHWDSKVAPCFHDTDTGQIYFSVTSLQERDRNCTCQSAEASVTVKPLVTKGSWACYRDQYAEGLLWQRQGQIVPGKIPVNLK